MTTHTDESSRGGLASVLNYMSDLVEDEDDEAAAYACAVEPQDAYR
ncbi:MAG: hypothetical protein ABEJ79_07770 [Halolamina sp.]